MRRDHPLVWRLELALFAIAIGCGLWVGMSVLQAAAFAREQRQLLDLSLASGNAAREARTGAPLAPGSLIGLLEIPRLRISEVVAEGDQNAVLDVAIGHLPDTPAPWQPGNSAVAAHRDTHFRPLRDIRQGDEIHLRTPDGTLRYEVRDIWIVDPDDVWVLDPTSHRRLTLITCYPFTFIGNAPQRFVVHADAIE